MYNIAILGAGALGKVFAYFLSSADNNVFLLTQDKNKKNKILKNGIYIYDKNKTYKKDIKIFLPEEINKDEINLVIVLVKSYTTYSKIISFEKWFKNNTVFLTLQNGINNVDEIKKALKKINLKCKVVSGVTSIGATQINEYQVKLTGIGKTQVEKDLKNFNLLSKIFSQSKLPVEFVNNIESSLWGKFILNCAINPYAAIFKLKNGDLIKNKSILNLMLKTAEEVKQLSIQKKIKLPFKNLKKKIIEVCTVTSENTNSMLADILNKNKTEIDFLNGYAVKLAKKEKINLPFNNCVTELVKAKESI